jgi:hypothetical protein
MQMTRQSVGEALAARLYAAEAAVDVALAETAQLAAMLPIARAEAYLSAVVGQKAFDGAAASIGALAAARSHLVDTHGALGALARKLGLDVLAAGPVDKPTDQPPRDGGGCTSGFPDLVNKVLPNSPERC